MPTDVLPDLDELRHGRRARALAAMEAHDLDLLVVGMPPDVRYLSGAPPLWTAGTRPFGPAAVLVGGTGDVHLLTTWDEGVPVEIPREHLYGITWNPMNLVGTLTAIGEAHGPRRVGVDGMSPLFAKLLPMAFPDAEIVDGEVALREARRIKTDAEVDALRRSAAVAEACAGAVRAALAPGATTRELTGIAMDEMVAHGVTTPAVQRSVRIATAGRHAETEVRAGDLVTVHAGVLADGYVGEVARTWTVGPADADAADLLARCDALRAALVARCRPGATGADLLAAYAEAGEDLPAAPVVHGLGLGLDEPIVARDLPETAAATVLEAGEVLALTSVVGDAAGNRATSIDAVHVTAEGPAALTGSTPAP